MQKFFITTIFILLSAITIAAQNADRQQKPLAESKRAEFSKPAETGRTVTAPATVTSGKPRAAGQIVDGRVLRLGPSTTYVKNGLRTDEVLRLLGKPTSVTERREGDKVFLTCTFRRSEARVFVAEFENGLLVSSRTEALETPVASVDER
jgi:hypothetical protein